MRRPVCKYRASKQSCTKRFRLNYVAIERHRLYAVHTMWLFIIYFYYLWLTYKWQITFLFCSVCGYLVFFWYRLLLHISLLISMHYHIHFALTAFIRLLHCPFCYVFAMYLYCVGCSCFTATFCGY